MRGGRGEARSCTNALDFRKGVGVSTDEYRRREVERDEQVAKLSEQVGRLLRAETVYRSEMEEKSA